MGWNPFKSKRKTVVHTALVRLVPDEQLPRVQDQALMQAVFEGGDISDYLLEAALTGPAVKFEHYFHYGRQRYIYGLPNSSVLLQTDAQALLQSTLEAQENQALTLFYGHYGEMHVLHYGWQQLLNTYGYNPVTNELTALSAEHGQPCYLHDLIAGYPADVLVSAEPGALTPIGPSPRGGYTPARPSQGSETMTLLAHSPARISPDGQEGVWLQYVYGSADNLTQVERWLPMSGVSEDDGYFQALYARSDGSWGVFTYRSGDNTYPELDALYGPRSLPSGSYFPIVKFRDDKQDLTKLTDSEAYYSSRQLLSYLGLDYAEIGANIHANPDIDDVEQAVLLMAVPVSSEEPEDLQYLFAFFRQLYFDQPQAKLHVGQAPPPNRALRIEDAGFAMTLSYVPVQRALRIGKVAEVGEVSKVRDRYEWQVPAIDPYNFQPTQETVGVERLILRRQLTPQHYEELQILDLQLRYHIDGKDFAAALGDDALYIPLDKRLTNTFPRLVRERLYYRSLHLVINTKIVQKIKWYEQGWFRSVMMIVAVIITIYSWGTAAKSIIAAASLGAAALATAILTVLVRMVVFAFVFRLVVHEVGVEAAWVLALVAAAAGLSAGNSSGGSGVAGAPWAQELLQLSSGLIQGVEQELAQLMREYQSELQSFNLMVEEVQAELDEVRRELNPDLLLDPFTFIGLEPLYLAGESPENFYHRTIDSGNIGTIVIDAIDNYVDYALRLPDFTDTVGEVFRG